jgi:hypothetical protein
MEGTAMKKLLTFLVAGLLCSGSVYADKQIRAVVSGLNGKVFVDTGSGWQKCYESMILEENSTIKTEPRSKVTILMDDNSKIQLKANSQLKLTSISTLDKVINLIKGKSVFKISRLFNGRKFQCKTPVAVCSVRGTEFTVEVGENNESTFKVFKGLVDVSNASGSESVSLTANQKINVTENAPVGSPTPFSVSDSKEKSVVVREAIAYDVGLQVSAEMTKEAVQKAAADEMRLSQYQEGKTIIDVFGQRVNISEYIIKTTVNPAVPNDSFKLVVLDERDNRYDYFTNTQQFNTTLPSDISVATKYWNNWQASPTSSNPMYYLLSNQSSACNLTDVVNWGYSGGHIVPNLTTGNGYQDLYDSYKFIINNTTIMSYAGTNIKSMNDVQWTVTGEAATMSNSQFFNTWWPANVTSTGDGVTNSVLNVSFKNGISYQESSYAVDDFGNIPSLANYQSNGGIVGYNQELVLSGSLFHGTGSKIDLCVEPKIFIDAGLISQ